MEYSKIKSVELFNFMSIKKAKIYFDETGIVMMKGYNDSGKSAVLRAVAVCLMNIKKSKQAKYIKNGEDYFRIVVSFEDGVSIIKDKYLNGQTLYEMYKDGVLVYTSKQGNRLARVEDVPEVISNYLGLCVTDSIFLNYLDRSDKMPVVEYSGSETYRMFHEVLRMEEIYRANNLINTDKNALSNEITELEVDIQHDEVRLAGYPDVDDDLISRIEELDAEETKLSSRKESIIGVGEKFNRLSRIPKIPKVEAVDTGRLRKINAVGNSFNGIVELPNIPKIEKVDASRLNNVLVVSGYLGKISNMEKIPEIPKVETKRITKIGEIATSLQKLGKFEEIPDISSVGVSDRDISKLESLRKLSVDLKRTSNMLESCEKIDKDIEDSQKEMEVIVKEAYNQGYKIIKCKNCGTYMLEGGECSNEVL